MGDGRQETGRECEKNQDRENREQSIEFLQEQLAEGSCFACGWLKGTEWKLRLPEV